MTYTWSYTTVSERCWDAGERMCPCSLVYLGSTGFMEFKQWSQENKMFVLVRASLSHGTVIQRLSRASGQESQHLGSSDKRWHLAFFHFRFRFCDFWWCITVWRNILPIQFCLFYLSQRALERVFLRCLVTVRRRWQAWLKQPQTLLLGAKPTWKMILSFPCWIEQQNQEPIFKTAVFSAVLSFHERTFCPVVTDDTVRWLRCTRLPYFFDKSLP